MELALATSCVPYVVGHSMSRGAEHRCEDGNSLAYVVREGGEPLQGGVTSLPTKVILSFVSPFILTKLVWVYASASP
jgi:hypothetical protein